MLEKLPGYRKQLEELDLRISSPEVMSDMKKYKELMVERSHIAPIVEKMEEMAKLEENRKRKSKYRCISFETEKSSSPPFGRKTYITRNSHPRKR